MLLKWAEPSAAAGYQRRLYKRLFLFLLVLSHQHKRPRGRPAEIAPRRGVHLASDPRYPTGPKASYRLAPCTSHQLQHLLQQANKAINKSRRWGMRPDLKGLNSGRAASKLKTQLDGQGVPLGRERGVGRFFYGAQFPL